ncbi:hypothetical protein LIER_06129 [Lithospermum erythrorhizon]|uniref:Uncharacterized protein n=1 Tax=Lithospermum erythrorhizon TaxID=34254 RepID=A0AAV3P366_LITER
MAVALYVQSLLPKKNKFQKFVLAMELIFLSTGFYSTLMMIKSSVLPHLPNNLIPTLFNSLLSSPLYIVIFMNLMIALIAVSSYFHKLNKNFPFEAMVFLDVDAALPKDPFPLSTQPPPPPPPSLPLPSAPPFDEIQFEADESSYSESHFITEENWKDIIEVAEVSKISKMYSLQSSPDVDAISRTQSIINDEQIQVVEGLVLEEDTANDEDGDNSLAEMWKAITGGAENSGKPELKKSETCPIDATNIGTVQSIDSKGLLPTAAAAWKELRKSVTFDDTISMRKRAGLMRDCLMSQESFGKRADDFIHKIKNTMRMERQASIIRSRTTRKN